MANNHGYHGDRFRPLNGVMGPLINGLSLGKKNVGDPNYSRMGHFLGELPVTPNHHWLGLTIVSVQGFSGV